MSALLEKPNIVLILADQMRADCLGVERRRPACTPHLDSLAARGLRFRHAYSPVPCCIPGRACLHTGMDAWHAGILGMGDGQRLIARLQSRDCGWCVDGRLSRTDGSLVSPFRDRRFAGSPEL